MQPSISIALLVKKQYKFNMINRKINWDRYRELLDIPDLKIRQLLTEKILDGSVKSREDIKQFKKLHLISFRTRRSLARKREETG